MTTAVTARQQSFCLGGKDKSMVFFASGPNLDSDDSNDRDLEARVSNTEPLQATLGFCSDVQQVASMPIPLPLAASLDHSLHTKRVYTA